MATERRTRVRSGYDRQWSLLVAVLLAVDGLMVWTSLTLAHTLRLSSGLLAYNAQFDPVLYRQLALAGTVLWLVLLALLGGYRRDVLLGGLVEYRYLLQASVLGLLGLTAFSFFWRPNFEPSRGWLLMVLPLSCVLLWLGRFLVRRAVYALRRRGWLTARVLIVGANDQGIAMAEQWLRDHTCGMSVVGFLDDFKPVGTAVTDGLEVLGRPTALERLAHETDVSEVVLVSGAVAWETFEEIIQGAIKPNGFILRLSPGFYEMLGTGVVVTNKSFVPLLNVNPNRLSGFDAVMKWTVDYAIGLAALCLGLPLMGLAALGLKAAGAGRPLLDRHSTPGQGGRAFKMLKFHTRPVSRFERWLLSSGLDKLPQLFNLMMGQMSLVGPRPRVLGEDSEDPATGRNLLTMKPGIIGPWTASGRWRQADEAQVDLTYVRNWTIWLDLQIMVETAAAWLRLGRPAPLTPKAPATGGEPESHDGILEAEHAARPN
jgi:lipopolysaccharide/colanic/teichoic acid biosynthesis glycosyltransferase